MATALAFRSSGSAAVDAIVPNPPRAPGYNKGEATLTVAGLFAESMRRINNEDSVSSLFVE